MKHIMETGNHWLAIFLLTDVTFIFLIWAVRPDALKSLSLFILTFTGLITAAAFFLERRRQANIARAAANFLNAPDEAGKTALLQAARQSRNSETDLLLSTLIDQAEQINEKTMELAAYREYIEAWVHEVKTPLSLSELVLNNHREEMSPYVYDRMNYAQHQLGENAERILYYARLQTEHADFQYTKVRLDTCAEDVAAQYQSLAEERQVTVILELLPLTVIADRRVTVFILSQILSNAMKYADPKEPKVSICTWQKEDTVFLAVRNNGSGIPPEDAPFLFDKGFTGSHPERQKATGMGLYLVKQYAAKLGAGVELEPVCTTGTGFGIRLMFKL